MKTTSTGHPRPHCQIPAAATAVVASVILRMTRRQRAPTSPQAWDRDIDRITIVPKVTVNARDWLLPHDWDRELREEFPANNHTVSSLALRLYGTPHLRDLRANLFGRNQLDYQEENIALDPGVPRGANLTLEARVRPLAEPWALTLYEVVLARDLLTSNRERFQPPWLQLPRHHSNHSHNHRGRQGRAWGELQRRGLLRSMPLQQQFPARDLLRRHHHHHRLLQGSPPRLRVSLA